MLLYDSAGRVLLVEPTYKSYWELPGGAVEACESPRAAAAREITEELGLARTPGRLIAVDWVPARQGRGDGLCVVFDGGTLQPHHIADITLPPHELHSYAFCDLPQTRQRLSPLLARRVAACLTGLSTGATIYLENGIDCSPTASPATNPAEVDELTTHTTPVAPVTDGQ